MPAREFPMPAREFVVLGTASQAPTRLRHHNGYLLRWDAEGVRLDHRADTFGWRVVEPDGRRMLPDRLGAAGINGADVGRLQRQGSLVLADGRVVTLEAMSEHRPGQKFAFVMDTRLCAGALALA